MDNISTESQPIELLMINSGLLWDNKEKHSPFDLIEQAEDTETIHNQCLSFF